MRKRMLTLAVALTAALTIFGMGTASAGSAKATLNVVHGIPGLDVDVCVDGTKAITDFNPGEVVAGVKLPAGTYHLGVVAAGTSCSAEVLAADATVAGGRNYTVVANLNASGTPNLKIFTNDVSKVDEGMVRLQVRHTAEAPAVNVWANGSPPERRQQVHLGRQARVRRAGGQLPGEGDPARQLEGGHRAGHAAHRGRVRLPGLRLGQRDAPASTSRSFPSGSARSRARSRTRNTPTHRGRRAPGEARPLRRFRFPAVTVRLRSMDVAVIGGTGAEGFGIALRLAAAGHHVVIGSREAERGGEAGARAVEELGGHATVDGTDNAGAANAADVVFVTVPFAAQADICRSIKEAVRPGSIVLDATSPLATAVGGRPWQLVRPWDGSAAEQARSILGHGPRVVAGFHTIAASALQDLGTSDRLRRAAVRRRRRREARGGWTLRADPRPAVGGLRRPVDGARRPRPSRRC